jgi:hypothetical protein
VGRADRRDGLDGTGLWSLDGTLLRRFDVQAHAVRFSPAGDRLAVGFMNQARLFDGEGALLSTMALGAKFSSLTSSPEGRLLIGTEDGRLTWWSQDGAQLR